MLVLTRKLGESIWVGDNVEIHVLECHSGGVKLGIDAPKDVLILRSEIRDLGEANRAAAQSHTDHQKLGSLKDLFKQQSSTEP